ncbi:hypothetical protein B5S28_g3181 [[Candida] boidinii]|nr:hypothetical protein B5S28_g3181 [[Candida] boidinii]OWB63746.1 hypothetical protein B5S29_g4752 [[Candida] boidinii]OWB75404.1 hypothetical protein B5S31_g5296 [[Candida] boidinii]OWB81011.1 hypothetical protein B5S32_g5352 [[Candida] boidinii]GME99613.1 unnamed protein product [[Candida] boidinii]
MSSTLFDDIFTIQSVDTARYDKVSRIIANSTTSKDTKLTIDINTQLFPVQNNENLSITLAKSLALDGDESDSFTSTNGSWRPPRPGQRSLMDDYDYCMHGTVYKFEENSNDKISVYVSFGGLLMCLEGNYRSLSLLKQENLYVLIRH